MGRKMGVVVALMAVLAFAVVGPASASILDTLVKGSGGGGANVAKLCANLPEDVAMVFSVNWENLSKTDLAGQLLQMAGGIEEQMKQFGIDIMKDPKHLLLGVAPTEDGDMNVYMVMAGKFDEDAIVGAIREQGQEPETRDADGTTVYIMEGTEFAFTPVGILAAYSGAEEPIGAMLKPEKSLADSDKMTALLKKTDTTGTAWGGILITEKMREEMGADEGEELGFEPKNLQWMSFSVNYKEPIAGAATLAFENADDAKNCVKYIKEQIADVLDDDETPESVAKVLKAVKFSAVGSLVTATGNVAQDDVQAAFTDVMTLLMGGPKEEPEGETGEGEEETTEEGEGA